VERFVKGDVVVIPFPFSDLSGVKRRPAFVLTDLPGDDIILCQITSTARADPFSIPISQVDFVSGSLSIDSFIRPNKIFTADKDIVLYTKGHLSDLKIGEILNTIISFLQGT
jgi:mRNA interferase MazF